MCGIPTINLPLQGVSLPFQLCFRAGTLQFDAGHLQFVRMLQTVNLRTRKKNQTYFSKLAPFIIKQIRNDIVVTKTGLSAAYLAAEGADLSLSFVQASSELAVLLVAQMKLAPQSLQLQTQRLTLRLSHQQPIKSNKSANKTAISVTRQPQPHLQRLQCSLRLC